MGFTTASLINEQRGDILQITTGAKEFDDILDGRMYPLPDLRRALRGRTSCPGCLQVDWRLGP